MSTTIITNKSNSVLKQALSYNSYGFSQLPVLLDGSKRPKLYEWAFLQKRLPTKDEINDWFANNDAGIGLICGEVSNNSICFDFEHRDIFDKWRSKVEEAELGDLLKKFPWIQTGGSGVHVLVRLHRKPPSGEHLAKRPIKYSKKPDLLLETRGEGNYIIAVGSPASVHESGNPYILLNGDLADVPILEDDIFEFFIELGKTFDEMPKTETKADKAQRLLSTTNNGRPGDDFNERATWTEILEPHGYKLLRQKDDEGFWRKPNSSDERQHHLTTNYGGTGKLFCFSTNAPPFETKKPYNKFAAYALLNHGGDFTKAAKALAEKGYGKPDVIKQLAGEIVSGRRKLTDIAVDDALKAFKKETGRSLAILRAALKVEVEELKQQSQKEDVDQFSQEELEAAEELLKQPNLFAVYDKDFALSDYIANKKQTTGGLLFLGRTLLLTSSAQYNHGRTSSGKTEFTLATVKFFPQHRVLNLTKITPAFLYRAGSADGKALVGKILVFGEMSPLKPGEDDEKQSAIRQFVSDNKLSLGTVDDISGQTNVATTRIAYGPVTIAFTGTRSPSEWDDQMINRSFSQHFKHSQKSIRKVLLSKATSGNISSNPFAIDDSKLVQAQRKWQAAFNLLKPLSPKCLEQTEGNKKDISTVHQPVTAIHAQIRTNENPKQPILPGLENDCLHYFEDHTHTPNFFGVEIPFLEQLIFKKKRLIEPDMRAFELLKNCISVSALLHQKTREVKYQDGKAVLVATPEDYLNIKDAFLEMVPRTGQGLSNDLIETFMKKLLPWWNKEENRDRRPPPSGDPLEQAIDNGSNYYKYKTKAQIAAVLGASNETVKRWIYAWCEADLLQSESSSYSYDRKSYYRLTKESESLVSEIKARGDLNIDEEPILSGTV